MASEGGGIAETPTYAVAITAFVFILVSLLVERGIHRQRKYLKKINQKPLRKVLDKMTGELMLLGFISLLITVLQNSIVKICVPKGFSDHMLPCHKEDYASEAFSPEVSHDNGVHRRLLFYFGRENMGLGSMRRSMSSAATALEHCASKGKVPFVSQEVLHQLHLFIFVLAVTHVFYSLLTVILGFARLHHWQRWERETRLDGYDGNIDLERRMCRKIEGRGPAGHADIFVDRHANHVCYQNPFSLWILCFFQQFVASISREDYLVFRVGFLNKHQLSDSFNFRDYVIRSLEVEFKKVIGISWWLWFFVVIFLLLNVHDWYTYFWAAFVPMIIVLVIGTKQQHIISTLALRAKAHAAEILKSGADIEKLPRSKKTMDIAEAVSPSDNLFWFDNPNLLLRLLHFVIFQNSFELAVFFWLVTTFGWNSCILGNHKLLIVRLVVGIFTQLLASYSTLPIYALVTQMGSRFKKTIFTKDVHEGIEGWVAKARRNKLKRESSTEDLSGTSTTNGSVTPVVEADENLASSRGPAAVPSDTEPAAMPSNRETQALGPARDFTPSQREGPISEIPADPKLEKMCQLMYGKVTGLEKIRAAQR